MHQVAVSLMLIRVSPLISSDADGLQIMLAAKLAYPHVCFASANPMRKLHETSVQFLP